MRYKNFFLKLIDSFIKAAALIALITIIFSFGVAIYDFSNFKAAPALKEQLFNFKEKKTDQYTIAIIAPVRFGEQSQAQMIYDSLEKMGHLGYIYQSNDMDMRMFHPARYLNGFFIHLLDYLFKTDFNLAMSFHVDLDVPNPKMMYISVPPSYFSKNQDIRLPILKEYKYFLDINVPNKKDDWLSDMLGKKVVREYDVVGIPANQYKSSKRESLLMYGSVWGRKGMLGTLNKLAKQDYMRFIKHSLVKVDISKDKVIEDNGTTADLQRVLNEAGIGLCMHSGHHLLAGIPSSRIFEIISSGAIAISDMNPFVVKNFGDSVFYYDQNLSDDEIFKQIDDHVKWIQNNPEKAELMAQKAHKILQDNFTTEHFINKMIKFYENKIRKS